MQHSVIICTHNPRKEYLRRVLTSLQMQTLAKDQWELLLVDNASSDVLASIWDLSWHPNARHIRENTPGKTYALLRAIGQFTGELFTIVDDDNVLREDYLQVALEISLRYPWLGAWSGSCLPEFELAPASDLRPWLGGLVIEKLTAPVWANLRKGSEAMPPGAGMVVRRKVAQRYRERVIHDPIRRALGHNGRMLSAGEDTDMALCGLDFGLGTGRFPELELTHLIPAWKVTLEYLKKLHDGLAYAGVVLDALYNKVDCYPGQVHSGVLRIMLLNILMIVLRKSRVERHIRLAIERGKLRARRDLDRNVF